MFFKVVGALLMVFAAGILVDAVQNLQELGWLPDPHPPDVEHRQPAQRGQHPRRHLPRFFGYAEAPTVGQVIVYVVYVVVVLGSFIGWHTPRRSVPARPVASPVSPDLQGEPGLPAV